ncbi:MAG: acyl-CoA dehydrogenase family protein [Dehalococcoidia bacterium]
MDFGYSAEQQALREEVRAFIKEHVTDDVIDEIENGHAGEDGKIQRGRGPLTKDLFRKIGERGWLGIAWPKEYGGAGKDRMTQYIVEEEFSRAGIGVGGGGSGAPAIMVAGTEEQKQYYIPRLISGEISFALGFTEPSCGADLAGLQCRAVRDGDEYVINGQKMYTSSAHTATHFYLMARTDPTAPRHKGISIFIFPMDTPGITVRPLWTLQNNPKAPIGTTYGTPRTNETFLEDVRVPQTALLGKENMGWYVGAMGLNLDRVGAWRYLISVRRDEDIFNFIKTQRDQYGWADTEATRDRLAEMWIEAQMSRLMTMRSMSIVEREQDFTYEGSAEKVWAPEHGIRVSETISQVLGPYAQLMNGSEGAIEDGIYSHNVLSSWISGVNHGSVQVMRDQIGRRGLGMARAT